MSSSKEISVVGMDSNILPADQFKVMTYCDQHDLLGNIKTRVKLKLSLPRAVLIAAGTDEPGYDQLIGYLEGIEESVPVFVIDRQFSESRWKEAKEYGAVDYLEADIKPEDLQYRIATMLELSAHGDPKAIEKDCYKMDPWKRAFDITIAGTLLLLLSPFFLVIAILIKLESPGKVFYYQSRVGTGYRVFKFYKFRSMRPDADKFVQKLQDKNQYAGKGEPSNVSVEKTVGPQLISDEGWIGESIHQRRVEAGEKNTFFKVKNDPRITKVGRFIRNTSIDELPQLFNVLKGDMSIVGNRPLPLYEAEKLTADDWAMRFLAPAGITGLWQVTERGKSEASADSRKRLDIEYALNHSFWGDMMILLKTPLAALQHENV